MAADRPSKFFGKFTTPDRTEQPVGCALRRLKKRRCLQARSDSPSGSGTIIGTQPSTANDPAEAPRAAGCPPCRPSDVLSRLKEPESAPENTESTTTGNSTINADNAKKHSHSHSMQPTPSQQTDDDHAPPKPSTLERVSTAVLKPAVLDRLVSGGENAEPAAVRIDAQDGGKPRTKSCPAGPETQDLPMGTVLAGGQLTPPASRSVDRPPLRRSPSTATVSTTTAAATATQGGPRTVPSQSHFFGTSGDPNRSLRRFASKRDRKCAVCLLSLTEVDGGIGVLDCGHSFCLSCITEWTLVSNTCPLCKVPPLRLGRFESDRWLTLYCDCAVAAAVAPNQAQAECGRRQRCPGHRLTGQVVLRPRRAPRRAGNSGAHNGRDCCCWRCLHRDVSLPSSPPLLPHLSCCSRVLDPQPSSRPLPLTKALPFIKSRPCPPSSRM